MAPRLMLQTLPGLPAGLAAAPFPATLRLWWLSAPDLARGLPHPPSDSASWASLTAHPSPVGVVDPQIPGRGRIPGPPLSGCITSGKLLCLSVPLFPSVKWG